MNADCKPNANWVKNRLDKAIGNESKIFNWTGEKFWSITNPECTTDDATLFVQFSCIQPADQ